MLFLILFFFVFMILVGYFTQLNPHPVPFFVMRDRSYDISLTALTLFSMAIGGAVVLLCAGFRQTKALYLNWTYQRRQKKEAQMESLYKKGLHAFLAKQQKEALSLLKKVVDLSPNHLPALLRLGDIHRMEGNVHEAIRLHRRARIVEDQNLEALLALVEDFRAAQQWEDALVLLKDVVRRDETNQTALMHLREIYMGQRHWEEAHSVQEKILKLSLSDNARQGEQAIFLGLKFESGMALLQQNQTEEARRFFKSAIKVDKAFLPAYIGLVEVALKEGKIESAMKLLEKGYDFTQNLILLHRLEDLCFEQGQPDRILQIYQKALAKNPGIALKFSLGKLYNRLEMVDEALTLLAETEGAIPYVPDLHEVLGNLHLRKGEFRLAAEAFAKALPLKADTVTPYTCRFCADRAKRWSGRCARCGQWNSYEFFPALFSDEKKEQAPVSFLSLSGDAERASAVFQGELF